jgi:hypothetical protein
VQTQWCETWLTLSNILAIYGSWWNECCKGCANKLFMNGAVGGQAPFSASASYLRVPKKVPDPFLPLVREFVPCGSPLAANLKKSTQHPIQQSVANHNVAGHVAANFFEPYKKPR